jgi:hypothetical protein
MMADIDELDDDDRVPQAAVGDAPEADEADESDDAEPAPLRLDAAGRVLVTVAGVDVALGVPRSPTVRMELTAMLGSNPVRVFAACLAACWQAGPSPGAPRVKLDQHGYSVMKFGGAAFDELAERGVPAADIIAAGQSAHRLLMERQITAEALKAAQDFTQRRTGGST